MRGIGELRDGGGERRERETDGAWGNAARHVGWQGRRGRGQGRGRGRGEWVVEVTAEGKETGKHPAQAQC